MKANRTKGDRSVVIANTNNTRIWTMVTAALLIYSAAAFGQSSDNSGSKRAPAQAQALTLTDAEFEQAVKLADDARMGGRLDEAVERYGKILRDRPKWTDGWWYLGTIFYERDLYADARNAFRNVVALDQNRGHAWGMLGLCEFQTREYDRAVVSLQRGRAIGMGDLNELESVVRYHAALLYIHFEQFEIAYDILTEFLRVGNRSPKVIQAFGLTILRLPLLPSEIADDKNEEVLIAGKAGFNMAARRPDETRAALDELLARYPDAPSLHYALGVFLLSQDSDAALKEFKRQLEITPSHQPAMVQMAFEYLKRGDYDAALPLAEKAVQLAPKMFPARNVLGRVLLELGQIDRAIKQLEEGARIAPTSPEMHYALGRAYRRAGREQDAKREVAMFQDLQEKFNARRNAELKAPITDKNQPTAKP
jgi:tetratricopeptide (TPR) repeat protein